MYPCVMYHVSCIMCHVLFIMCHGHVSCKCVTVMMYNVSCVMYNVSCVMSSLTFSVLIAADDASALPFSGNGLSAIQVCSNLSKE